jgi:hypothetical protein
MEKFGVVVLPWPDRKKKANRTGPAVFAIKRSAHAADDDAPDDPHHLRLRQFWKAFWFPI